jgi:hypothetical protein
MDIEIIKLYKSAASLMSKWEIQALSSLLREGQGISHTETKSQ